MGPATLAAMALLGLASGVHCAGMCGGIVGAFSVNQQILFPGALLRRQLAFNAGRVASYTLAGAAVGAASSAGAWMAGALPVQAALFVATNVILVLTGMHLLGVSRWIARLEPIGQPIWKRLQPHAAKALGARTLRGAFAAGMLWGGLPCGLVYGALAVAAFSGSAAGGAAILAAFGAGTLPNLLAAGFAASGVRAWLRRPAVRTAAASAIITAGTYGLAHASGIVDNIRQGLLCL
ncbi:MAG: sulfite exporter TauE/SafE family protein [Clostridia bacterium]